MDVKIGIDLSLNHTGLIIIRPSKISKTSSQRIKLEIIIPNSKLSQEEKMIYTANSIVDIINKYTYSFDNLLINIERPFFMGRYSNNISTLNGIFYVVICFIKESKLLQNNKIIFKYISPNTVKKKATGNGRASKEEVYNTIPITIKKKIEKTNDKHNDLSDAYWISQC